MAATHPPGRAGNEGDLPVEFLPGHAGGLYGVSSLRARSWVPVAGTGAGWRLQSPVVVRRLFTVAVLTLLLIVAAVAVGADIGGRAFAEHLIANRAKSSTGANRSSASISSFPFLYDLLVEGKTKEVNVDLQGVPLGPLRIDRIDLKAHGVHVETGYLIDHQKVRIKSIESADATMTLTAASLSAATGLQVVISGDTVTASLGGVSIPASIAITGGHDLTLDVQGHRTFTFDVDRSPIIPPCDMHLTTANDGLTLECHVSPVPPTVIAAISARTSG